MTTLLPYLLTHYSGGVATLTLNRPERMNAFIKPMHQALRDELDRIETDPAVKVLVLTGAGRGFCAGQDLAERVRNAGDPPPDLGASLDENYNPLVLRLRALPKPVICAVNGVAAGAGANLALAADFVIAAESASFLQAFAKIGLIPDAGGTYFVPRLIGTARAMSLMALAEPLKATEAASLGLIYKCVPDEVLMTEAHTLAERLSVMPPLAFAALKKALYNGKAGLQEQLLMERDLQRELGRSDDYAEGVAAFKEKRKPQFQGK
jgi:2-(1,2-epoxy-1,2-dihydrophenyl)acetyl-CoA isomerase